MVKLIKLVKMASGMHKVDHAHSIWSTWWLRRSAKDASLGVCVINSSSILTFYLDLSNFRLESGSSYFSIHLCPSMSRQEP